MVNQWRDLEQAKRRRGGRGCADHIFTLYMWHRPFLWSLLQWDRKIVNTWNISGMLIALWTITAKIRTRELDTKPQTVINVLACRLVSSRLFFFFFFFSRNTLTFQKYFWCSRFSLFVCKLAWDQAPRCGEKGKKIGFSHKKKKGLLRSPIFFLFDPVFCLLPPMRSLVPG